MQRYRILKLLSIIVFIYAVFTIVLYNVNTYKIADWQVRNKRIVFPQQGYGMQYAKVDVSNIFGNYAYERALIEACKKKGIPENEIEKALKASEDKIGLTLTKIPVLIDTGRYQNRDVLILNYRWGMEKLWPIIKIIPQLREKRVSHVWTIIVDIKTNKIVFSEHCM